MQDPKTDTIIGRYYQHFKGNKYVILHEAKDSETDAPLIVYQALYGNHQIWVRPKQMFFENVTRENYSGPRFQEISKEDAPRCD